MIAEEAQEAIQLFVLPDDAEICRQLRATHAAFMVRAGDGLYALRQLNPYVDVEDLRAQFVLAELIGNAGLNTPLPVRAKDGEAFVVVRDRLWALFPWCDGRPGSSDRLDDLMALASVQGAWVECCERLRLHSRSETIVRAAGRFRQRKSWAWVVPLDRVPRFAAEHMVIETARARAPKGPHRKPFLDLLPALDTCLAEFDQLLTQQCVFDLPHSVTHGDFWASNICISDQDTVVLDLDCFSYEPRVADFARAANWYYRQWSARDNACLFRQFRSRAGLSDEETEALPMMMCAHDVYYAVSHVLLLPEENAAAQYHLIESIRSEVQAVPRLRRERDSLLRMFLQGE